MALMIPISPLNFDTPGEEFIYYQLQTLSDEFTVFYNPKSKFTSNIDFILLSPYGVLFIEVKDWSLHYIKKYSRNEITLANGRIDTNPLLTSQDRAFDFVKQLKKPLLNSKGKFKSVYSGLAWYPNMSDSDISRLKGPSGSESLFRPNKTRQIVTSDTLKCKLPLSDLLHSCFEFNSYTPLSNDEINYIRDLILNECFIYSNIDELINALDIEQYKLATKLDYSQSLIIGAAGTGKTVLCISRSIFLSKMHPSASILVLINSQRNLAKLAIHFSKYSNIVVDTKHNIDNLLAISSKYDMLLIDELQDYSLDDIIKAKSLLYNPTVNHFIGFLDAAQDTYSNSEYDLLSIGNIFYLNFCYRNGETIFNAAKTYLPTSHHTDTSSKNITYYNKTITQNKIPGEFIHKNFTISKYNSTSDFSTLDDCITSIISNILNHLLLKGYPLNNIAILYIGRKNTIGKRIADSLNSHGINFTDSFSPNDNELILLPHAAAKGADFKVVITFASSKLANFETSALLSITRAREISIFLTYDILS